MLNWIYSLPNHSSDENKGTVVEILNQGKEWQIDFQATYWIARSASPLTLRCGDDVRVVGRFCNTLLIEKI
jgi:membrane protein implicated in regulation of membrane protease activity